MTTKAYMITYADGINEKITAFYLDFILGKNGNSDIRISGTYEVNFLLYVFGMPYVVNSNFIQIYDFIAQSANCRCVIIFLNRALKMYLDSTVVSFFSV